MHKKTLPVTRRRSAQLVLITEKRRVIKLHHYFKNKIYLHVQVYIQHMNTSIQGMYMAVCAEAAAAAAAAKPHHVYVRALVLGAVG